ncbi:uncharacterized protein METZ01_LOCUS264945, partial [marine metagenome]
FNGVFCIDSNKIPIFLLYYFSIM